MPISGDSDRDRPGETTPLERRAYPRYPLLPLLRLEVELQPSGSHSRPAVAVDISRSGMRLHLTEEMEVGTDCTIRFPEDDGRFRPTTADGIIRRLERRDEVFLVVVEFREPLASLRLESERGRNRDDLVSPASPG